MQQDIWKFSLILIISAVVGFSLGKVTVSLLVAALGIIVWQIYRLKLLHDWIINPKKNPLPETSGQFYLLHREINRKNIKNANRKRQLSNYLTQFRKAASALPDAIVLIDDFGRIEWANKNASTVFDIHWPSDAQVRFGDLVRNPEVEKLLNQDDESRQGVEIRTQNDPEQIINIKIIRYTNLLRMVIARDVSRLMKVNQMQSDFVANVSHELKTPLTVLKGYLEIMQGSLKLPEQLHKPLEQMSTQTDRMNFIVNDLLYLAKLEDKENVADHELIDVTHIVNTIHETIEDKINEKNHKLELDIDYNILILGNQTELHAAFSNLIFNAINYTPKGGLIRIKWHTNELKGASFSVIDDGEGIAKTHLSRLTRRFYRVDTDRSREGGGTGLGLAIVKHVLQRHNASLKIDSTLGVGSEFTCIFPSNQIQLKKSSEAG